MRIKTLLLSILSILLSNGVILANETQQDVLCAEIGGKKIIAALLPPNPTLEQLKDVAILTFPSKPWFTQLPFLFSHSRDNPLFPLISQPHSQIAVSIFGPLFRNEGLIDVANRNIPPDIRMLCKEQSQSPLDMFTDSICWAAGCLQYFELKAPSYDASEAMPTPFLGVILKTGVGVALVEQGKVSAIEIPYIGCTFPKLEVVCLAQGQTFEKFNVHQALGNGFFDWVLNKRDFDDSEMSEYLDLYNQRFHVFIEELSDFAKEKMNVDIKSVYVGGENSRFIHPFQAVTVLNANTLAADGIAPEIIQLIGCLKLIRSKEIIFETYPSYDEITQQIATNQK